MIAASLLGFPWDARRLRRRIPRCFASATRVRRRGVAGDETEVAGLGLQANRLVRPMACIARAAPTTQRLSTTAADPASACSGPRELASSAWSSEANGASRGGFPCRVCATTSFGPAKPACISGEAAGSAEAAPARSASRSALAVAASTTHEVVLSAEPSGSLRPSAVSAPTSTTMKRTASSPRARVRVARWTGRTRRGVRARPVRARRRPRRVRGHPPAHQELDEADRRRPPPHATAPVAAPVGARCSPRGPSPLVARRG